MSARTSTRPVAVAVLLGDPRLPYAYAMEACFGAEEQEAVEQLKAALAALEGFTFTYLDDHTTLLEDLRQRPPSLVLNLCDTGFRNDMARELNIPALLEILNIPYSGADPVGMSLATDKSIVRAVARSLGIPVPNEMFVDLEADPLVLPTLYPALIKPNFSDGSFGITAECVVHDAAAAERYLHWLAGKLERPEALVQDFLTGAEYTVGLIGNAGEGFTYLPPLEVDYSRLDPELPAILSYASKAEPDSPYWQKLRFRRARIDEVTRGRLYDHCVALFKRLGLRDYARFDFRAGADGEPRLLEVNHNPAWAWDGKLSMMAGYAGYSYSDLLRLILAAAMGRIGLGAARG
ncbi:MAG: D-alanine--D-alanine ligase [Nitrococcus mobilis]|nr:D-alanine--D-alanine ligase [Nitrococcus mobilis]